MKIAVGLSGGVDSAVTAALLQESGHEVIGITMKIWSGDRYRGGAKDACFGPGEADDILRAERLCEQLGIEYRVFDCTAEYEKVVLDYFRREYLAGHTPNPCVFCNAFMKFGVLPHLAAKSGLQFERFATGHYARIDGVSLYRGLDTTKDQSYFLYRLKRQRLENLLFPLGNFTKLQVREMARKYDLDVKDKPDSQDFYSGDHTELLETPDRGGNIVDTQGHVLGTHNGFWHYTIGQRKGLGVAAKHPLYVLELNACRNEVVVGSADDTLFHFIKVENPNYLAEVPEAGTLLSAKIRSAGNPIMAKIISVDTKGFSLEFPDGVHAPAKGQSAVLYDAERVIGGGIISGVS